MLVLRNTVKEEKRLKIYGGLREDIGMKTYLHGPNGLREETKTSISSTGIEPTGKKKEMCQ